MGKHSKAGPRVATEKFVIPGLANSGRSQDGVLLERRRRQAIGRKENKRRQRRRIKQNELKSHRQEIDQGPSRVWARPSTSTSFSRRTTRSLSPATAWMSLVILLVKRRKDRDDWKRND